LTPDAIGAATDEFAPVPYLRFDEKRKASLMNGGRPSKPGFAPTI
jgi:hypothetical protein